jgi:hypothetical protein
MHAALFPAILGSIFSLSRQPRGFFALIEFLTGWQGIIGRQKWCRIDEAHPPSTSP